MEHKDKNTGGEQLPQETVDKENKTDKVKLKKTKDVDFSITLKNESSVDNGDFEEANLHMDALSEDINVVVKDDKSDEVLFSKEYNSSDYLNTKSLDLDKLKSVYNSNGNSPEKTYQYLKNYIMENKNNPETLQSTVSELLNDFSALYDESLTSGGVGTNQIDILDKIINVPEGETLNGFICGPMHNFIIDTLNECGIKAVGLIGNEVNAGNHATLLYQIEDGKYVFNDYSTSIVINASNIKDAVREVYKKSNLFEGSGYITLQDGRRSSYQEFAFEQEAAFGKEMDKRDYHSETPFDISIQPATSINGNVELSTNGNFSAQAGGLIAYGNSVKDSQTSLNLAYKKNNETAMFVDSESVGLKVEHKKINQNTGVFCDIKGISSFTTGKLDSSTFTGDTSQYFHAQNKMFKQIVSDLQQAGFDNYETDKYARCILSPEEIEKMSHSETQYYETKQQYLSNFIKGSFGKQKTLLKDDNFELTNAAKATAVGGMTFNLVSDSFNGDLRLIAEDGLQLKNTINDFKLNNEISGGLISDLKLNSTGAKFKMQPGVKLNAGTSVAYSSNPNFGIVGGVKVSSVVTPADKDFGVQGRINAVYKPENSNIVLQGDATAGLYKQKITMGHFNEQTENVKNFSVGLGAQLNPRTSVSVRYNNEINALNKTKNNSSFTIGTRITF